MKKALLLMVAVQLTGHCLDAKGMYKLGKCKISTSLRIVTETCEHGAVTFY